MASVVTRTGGTVEIDGVACAGDWISIFAGRDQFEGNGSFIMFNTLR